MQPICTQLYDVHVSFYVYNLKCCLMFDSLILITRLTEVMITITVNLSYCHSLIRTSENVLIIEDIVNLEG